ncbi:Vid24 family cytoplasmic vesicle protein [Schizosaccharomyces japonicus yFS275]|uniref:Vid24 family cytoplasmic vesicle protein n=1 Tax=Schizosaccharomyces japonicus (strain yFS275 / FY16936) TaxID=402676 RepID=B6K435_SCHJY|nr:Vid24 family cytoplasmic vesicle protein [Schizosaccharomyces japonicus yFS275]EEB08242.1 Vid24 family cytoplasmic vesicle protein [Schizosaccharomyces japonicus yFS275]
MECFSFLRNGSVFRGKQMSERAEYNVHVTILHVNLRESMLCGYFHIDDDDEHNLPLLTTYFEAEIIGEKFSFLTKWPEWGANESIDFRHWKKLGGLDDSIKNESQMKNYVRREPYKHDLIFMRWKELALFDRPAPGSRLSHAPKAVSYEGFYYIAFRQSTGEITGYYYHNKSNRYEYLEFKPVINKTFPLYEFN